jgi:LAO/AO transport system kinase
MPERAVDSATQDLATSLRAGDRAALGRAITLVESQLPAHRAQAQQLLTSLMPYTSGAHRVGITGPPGVGKSTFIETLGMQLIEAGQRVAVLAVDPSSGRSGGSILGDKTRMQRLSVEKNAFIRPSPSSGSLGGVGRSTRETILLCEAAGYDRVLVETVGVGQSETLVAGMVDSFLLLMLPGAGDELQGIKRGILELADVIAVNKADGDGALRAENARSELARAIHLLRPRHEAWRTPVLSCSALGGDGVAEVWAKVQAHRASLEAADLWDPQRRRQRIQGLWALVDDTLREALHAHPDVQAIRESLEAEVAEGRLSPTLAAERILKGFGIGN